MSLLSKEDIDLINKMAESYWIENNRNHDDNEQEWELTLNFLKKLTKPNVKNSDIIHECNKCMFDKDLGFCPKCDTDCYSQ